MSVHFELGYLFIDYPKNRRVVYIARPMSIHLGKGFHTIPTELIAIGSGGLSQVSGITEGLTQTHLRLYTEPVEQILSLCGV